MPFLQRRRPRPGLRPRPRQMLERAHRLFDRGEFAEAAPIFDRLAEGAAERGMLNRAGDLYLQSARCHLEMGKAAAAVERGKHALRLFGRAGLFGKIERLMPRMVETLQEKGYQAEAEALRQEVEARLAEVPPERRAPPGARPAGWPPFARPATARRQLPAKCSACGAPVKPDEVTWLDPQTAECPYCGAVVKAS
jgi:predicted RNA-binding Zn-ribbon protein involved in translation (DUF1610 family)